MPLPRLVLHLLGAGSEDLATAIAPRSELHVIAIATVNSVRLGAKLLINQRNAALIAEEACLMPVLILVGEVLGVNSNYLVATLASVGKDILIALDAIGMIIAEDIALPSEGFIALPAAEVGGVPILGHGFRVLPTEN
uniref:Uncharacterized protein n=1 Tax=Lutzomyia longipalpis TaxID=7200 RepID=A0A7G3B5T7_LUTLO